MVLFMVVKCFISKQTDVDNKLIHCAHLRTFNAVAWKDIQRSISKLYKNHEEPNPQLTQPTHMATKPKDNQDQITDLTHPP